MKKNENEIKNNKDNSIIPSSKTTNKKYGWQRIATGFAIGAAIVTVPTLAITIPLMNSNNNNHKNKYSVESAKQVLNQIKSTNTLVGGATEPITEKTNYEKVLAAALATIDAIKHDDDNSKALFKDNLNKSLTSETTKVTTARDAYDQAIMNANNDANRAKVLAVAKADAKKKLNEIEPTIKLIADAVLPQAEKSTYEAALNNALKAIQNDSTEVEVNSTLQTQIQKEIKARDAYDKAIEAGNKKATKDLADAKTKAKTELDNIKPAKNLNPGATLPKVEEAAYKKSLDDAKKAIDGASKKADVSSKLAVEKANVSAALDAYNVAIQTANDAKTTQDLADAIANAKTELDNIKPVTTLNPGATLPQAEKATYDKSLDDAKKAIDGASTTADVSSKLAVEKANVSAARDAYNVAIQTANDAKTAQDLADAIANAKTDLDNIKPVTTLSPGATLPQAEKATYDKSLDDAKKAIDGASTTADVSSKLAVEKANVSAALDAYNVAIQKANDAKTAQDLADAKTKAKTQLDNIKPVTTLNPGATLPQSEKATYDKSLADAKTAIDGASTTADVSSKLAVEKANVSAALDAYNVAIQKANDAKTTQDLADAIAKAKTQLDNIKPVTTLNAGATLPQAEKATYDKSLDDAKKAIDGASTTADVSSKLAVEKANVSAALDAYNAAIQTANDAKTAQDLADAIANAKTDLDNIKPVTTLNPGATLPQAEKATYDKSLDDAKKAIEGASTTTEVGSKLAVEKANVSAALDAYNVAIQKANDAKTAQDLADAKTKAKTQLDNIKPVTTLNPGATLPQAEKATYDKSLADAKTAIDGASTTADVSSKLAVEKANVSAALDAYNAAIQTANDAKTAQDLADAIAKAKTQLDNIKPVTTLSPGATLPQAEKDAYDKSLDDAKKAIDGASTTADVSSKLAVEKANVSAALDAYNAAIQTANDAKTAQDLADAIANAKTDLDNIKPVTTLNAGATEPQTEKDAYDKSLADAKAAIEGASTTTEVGSKLAVEKANVSAALDAYNVAIQTANDAKTTQDLADAKTKAKTQLDNIKPVTTLNPGATLPQAEKATYDKSLADAKKAIDGASTTADVSSKLAVEKANVSAALDAYNAAIQTANDAKTAQDLADAIANAKTDLDNIKPVTTLNAGATEPQTEKDAYDKSLADAKAAIEGASTTADVSSKLAVEKANVSAARDAYNVAIQTANDAKTTQDLADAKTKAKTELDNIKPAKNLNTGATLPQAEKATYDKSLDDAKKAIDGASTTADVSSKLAVEKANVSAALDAYNAAIQTANDAKTAQDLADAIANAKTDLDNIKPVTTLNPGATEPQTEKDAYNNSLADAKTAIDGASTTADVSSKLAVEKANVSAALDAYNAAIQTANDAKTAQDLADAIANAKTDLDNIKPVTTLSPGATLPQAEKDAYNKSLDDAKAAIEGASTTTEVGSKLAVEKANVSAALDAYNAAIEAVNKKTAQDLADAIANAKTDLDNIKPVTTLNPGATLPQAEKATYDKSLADAKTAIDGASTTADVSSKLAVEKANVSAALNAYNAAIQTANDAKTAQDLADAIANAKTDLDNIKPVTTLNPGATEPQTEKDAYNNSLADAKTAIEGASTTADVSSKLAVKKANVSAARDAYNVAIQTANDAKTTQDLADAIANAKTQLDNIKPVTTLNPGATEPQTEKATYDKSLDDAKKAIDGASTTTEVGSKLAVEKANVSAALDAYNAAIEAVNKKTAQDLADAKTKAKTDLDNIKPVTTLNPGATEPQTEKATYDKSLDDAKAAIEGASTTADVSSKLAVEKANVSAARDAYNVAIQTANDAKTAQDLADAIANAKTDLDNIKPVTTLNPGATLPQAEKATYDKSLADAKAAIEGASTTTEVDSKLAVEKTNVSAALDAYNAAIQTANDAKTAQDLADAIANAKTDLDNIKPAKTLNAAATPAPTLPQAEKATYDKSLIDAKKAIDSASTTAEVGLKLAVEKANVSAARDAYDVAIEAANKLIMKTNSFYYDSLNEPVNRNSPRSEVFTTWDFKFYDNGNLVNEEKKGIITGSFSYNVPYSGNIDKITITSSFAHHFVKQTIKVATFKWFDGKEIKTFTLNKNEHKPKNGSNRRVNYEFNLNK